MVYSYGVFVNLSRSRGFLLLLFAGLLVILSLHWLVNDFHEVLLQGFLFHYESVLVPDEVWDFGIPAIFLHASLEQV